MEVAREQLDAFRSATQIPVSSAAAEAARTQAAELERSLRQWELILAERERIIAADEDAPTTVLVTHHVEEIPPHFTDVLLMREGRVVAQGPIEITLTEDTLEATFGIPLVLEVRGDRYPARAR